MRERDFIKADTLYRKQGTADTLQFLLLQAYKTGDVARQKAILDAYEKRVMGTYAVTMWLGYIGRPDEMEKLARIGATKTAKGARYYGYLSLSDAVASRGRFGEAFEALDAAESKQTALNEKVELAMQPFAQIPREQLLRIRDEVFRSDSLIKGDRAVERLQPHFRLYQLGMLSCRLGNTADALTYVERLEKLDAPTHWQEATQALATNVRAQIDVTNGDPAQALKRLQSITIDVPFDLVNTPAVRNQEIAWRAELLYQVGRYDEAEQWFENLPDNSDRTVATPFAMLRRAQIYDRRGQSKLAAPLYAEFLRYWANADPELQPVVRQARARLEAMQEQS